MDACFPVDQGRGMSFRRLGSRYGRTITAAANVRDHCEKNSERTHHSGARAIVNTG